METYFYILPNESFHFTDFYSKKFFEELIKIFNSPVPLCKGLEEFETCITLNNFYSSFNSYILRKIINEIGPNELGVTIEIYENGQMKLLLPLPQFSDPLFLLRIYNESNYLKEFIQQIKDINNLRIIDGHSLLLIFANLINQYINLLMRNNFTNKLNVRLRLTNTWKTIIYFDSENYIKFIKQYGLPICIKDEIEMPSFRRGRGLEMDIHKHNGLDFMSFIYAALGIPCDFVIQFTEGLYSHFMNMLTTKNQ
jgi:hypothetical protein